MHLWSIKERSVHLFPVSTPPPAIIHISLNVCLQIRKLGRKCEVWYFKQRLEMNCFRTRTVSESYCSLNRDEKHQTECWSALHVPPLFIAEHQFAI